MQICNKCKEYKEFKDFHKGNSKNSLQYMCKLCKKETISSRTEYYKNYYKDNKERIKEYQIKNKEHISLRNKKWKDSNKQYVIDYTNKYFKQRKKEDDLFRLAGNLRSRLSYIIKNKGFDKNYKLKEYIGCDLETLKKHLESQFEPWMTWDNYGVFDKNNKTWQIDHIIPLSSANNETELYKLAHYTNLKPLNALDNIIKNAKIL